MVDTAKNAGGQSASASADLTIYHRLNRAPEGTADMHISRKLQPLTATEIQLIDMAKSNLAFIEAQPDRAAALKDMFAEVDTVQAVYDDTTNPTGIGVRFIFGEEHCRNFMSRGTPMPSRNSAIWVKAVEEAEAMRLWFGDGRPKADRA
jgi:hypothetical protein